ncbi:MAG TPA: TMEM175 family protein [Caulobacteraceae bacterium]
MDRAEATLDDLRQSHWFDRVVMLSDGVFAIAITLLAFDIHGPARWSTLADIWSALAPQLDMYALSFLVISVYWLAHRRFMAMIVRIDAPATVLNLIFLALVTLLPAATKLVHAGGPTQASMVVYSALVVGIGVALACLWGYAGLVGDLVQPDVIRPVRWFLLVLILLTPPLFLFLVNGFGNVPYFVAPLLLALLFIVGWPLRLFVLHRLQANRHPTLKVR